MPPRDTIDPGCGFPLQAEVRLLESLDVADVVPERCEPQLLIPAGGLPYPFFPILKSVILLMPLAVGLQGLSLVLRSLPAVRGR